MTGWRVEARLIIVDSGQLGGIYTYYCSPEKPYFIVHTGDVYVSDASGNVEEGQPMRGYRTRMESCAEGVGWNLVKDLRP